MPTPPYVLDLRRSYGSGRLLLPGVCAVLLRTDLEPGRTHLLMNLRTDTGRWSLPAGIVEPDEQPATTILRELLEETCVVARVDRLAWVHTDPDTIYPNGDQCQFITLIFRCSYVSGEARVGDDESAAVAWFPLDALPELEDLQRRRVDIALAEGEGCRFEL